MGRTELNQMSFSSALNLAVLLSQISFGRFATRNDGFQKHFFFTLLEYFSHLTLEVVPE